jgi:hypothetical protein
MKKILMYSLLVGLLSSAQLVAQPVSGQYYGTLRAFGLSLANQTQLNPFTQVNETALSAGLNLQMLGARMLSDDYSIGVGLLGSYSIQGRNGDINQVQYGLGILMFSRRWYKLRETIFAHVDLQGSYFYAELLPGATQRSHQVQLGVLPGISWFFRPKWAIEGRMGGVYAQFLRNNGSTGFTSQVNMRYNVNPLDMQFAISRFF